MSFIVRHPTLVGIVLFLMAAAAEAQYKAVPDWLNPPSGRATIGDMHGDVAVSSAGEIFVSVQEPGAGLQVYGPDGTFRRNVPNSPGDFHGFVIREWPDGEFLYGATLVGQTVVKMTLDGRVVMTIPASRIPDEYKLRDSKTGELVVRLTSVDVAPNGDIYVTDGYSSDYIHRFDRGGLYVSSFGGKESPYGFSTLHKIAIDTRFDPPRIIGTDRANHRLVHLSLDGEVLGTIADDLRLPAAVTVDGDRLIVGELRGRVTILDREGRLVARLGTNDEEGIGGNRIPPEGWRPGVVVSPHGVATNTQGDLFVSEYSVFGRVHRFNQLPDASGQ